MTIDEGICFRGQHYSVYGDYVDGRITGRKVAWYSTTEDATFLCTSMAESIQVVTCLGATSLAEYLEILAVEQYEENQKEDRMKDSGFEAPVVQAAGGVQVEETRAAAEVKAQVFMAKQYPRDTTAAIDRILKECDRPTLAEQAEYSFPKGGSQITGPSIRLAEAIARGWGNIAYGTIEVER